MKTRTAGVALAEKQGVLDAQGIQQQTNSRDYPLADITDDVDDMLRELCLDDVEECVYLASLRTTLIAAKVIDENTLV